MNYKIKNIDSKVYEVIETKTEQKIRTFPALKDAREFMRHLNLGGGFDGWTPNFVVKPIELKSQSA